MRREDVIKAVSEKFAVELYYKTPDLMKGETITAVETSISPSGLEVQGDPQISADGRGVSQMIHGGLAGVNYEVLFKVTTSAGHVYNRPGLDSVLVKVI